MRRTVFKLTCRVSYLLQLRCMSSGTVVFRSVAVRPVFSLIQSACGSRYRYCSVSGKGVSVVTGVEVDSGRPYRQLRFGNGVRPFSSVAWPSQALRNVSLCWRAVVDWRQVTGRGARQVCNTHNENGMCIPILVCPSAVVDASPDK